jgi:hypothetical protein
MIFELLFTRMRTVSFCRNAQMLAANYPRGLTVAAYKGAFR